MPPSDVSHADLTAGAIFPLQQTPLPITMSGTVFEDLNANNTQQSGEPGIAGVALGLAVPCRTANTSPPG